MNIDDLKFFRRKMFNIDDKDFKQLEKNLNEVHKHALVDTVRATLDKEAFETMKIYKSNVKSELTIRTPNNNIVLKSIGYDKSQYSEHNINNLESKIGQRSTMFGKDTEQLKKQEFGETLISKGKYTPKATKMTRSGSYKKTVPKANLMARVNVEKIEKIAKHPVKNNTQKQFKQAIAVAHNTHKTINFIPDSEISNKKFGIFQLNDKGTIKAKDGTKRTKGNSVKLLYSFKDKKQQLKQRPMLKPASEKVFKESGNIFKDEADKRIFKELSKNLQK